MKLSAEELHAVLLIFREHLLPCWQRLHAEIPHGMPLAFPGSVPEILSSMMCQQTTAFLHKQLSRIGVDDVELCGGAMRHAEPLEREDPTRRDVDDEGYVWSGHYWLEHNGLIIDITKDQFGWDFDEIHDVESAALIYWKRPGFFPESGLGMFAAAVSKFEGQPQAVGQDDEPHFVIVLESFEEALRRVSGVFGLRPPSPT
jgi:hypothetical protein